MSNKVVPIRPPQNDYERHLAHTAKVFDNLFERLIETVDQVRGKPSDTRCEMFRTDAGEMAQICNAHETRECKYCGWICGRCASELVCSSPTGQHEFTGPEVA